MTLLSPTVKMEFDGSRSSDSNSDRNSQRKRLRRQSAVFSSSSSSSTPTISSLCSSSTSTTTTTTAAATTTATTLWVIKLLTIVIVSDVLMTTPTAVHASLSLQHKVKPAKRTVPYQHIIQNRPKEFLDNSVTHSGNAYNDVVRRLSTSSSSSLSSPSSSSLSQLSREQYYHRNHEQLQQQEQQQELQYNDYWVLYTTAAGALSPGPAVDADDNNNSDDGSSSSNLRRNLSSLWTSTRRNLFEQFVGGDKPPSSDTTVNDNSNSDDDSNNVTTTTATIVVNVTTEVEVTESVVFEDESGGTASSTQQGDGNTSHVSSSANVMPVGGEDGTTSQVNITNITETVIYTENKNVTADGNAQNVGGGYGSGTNDASTSSALNGTNTSSSSNSSSVGFQPLRIRAILAEKSSSSVVLNETERHLLFHDMLSPALLAWSTSLRVDPVVGNLTVDVNQLVDGKTCGPGVDSGLPSVEVPIQHLEEGIPDTDLIVYLSLGRAWSDITSNVTSNEGNGDGTENHGTDNESHGSGGIVEEKYYDGGPLIDRSKDKDVGLNVQDLFGGFRHKRRQLADSIDEEVDASPRKVSIQDAIVRDEAEDRGADGQSNRSSSNNTREPINICTGTYLAAASYCSTDQYDRPTAALLHVCIGDDFFDPKNFKRNIMTLMHELAHALGFNSRSMAHFRRPDGTPYTPRDENGEIPETEVECTGPGLDHQYASLALPSEAILKFRTVRGGVRVAEVVTPSVLQVVRNQFDCQLLTGAELESGEGLPLSVLGEEGCIGDHWERRLFSSDLMNPIVDGLDFSTRISTLTLAYFADSGWYQVDLSQANVAPGWGRGSGCSFVNDTCVSTTTGEVPPQNAPFFCNDISAPSALSLTPQDIHGCTPDLSRKAKCSIGQYDLALPAAYQYFNNTYGADVGGSDALMDFCPVYAGYENGLCSSAESASVIRAVEIERFGERNSRCLTGKLSNAASFQRTVAMCLPIACVIKDRTFRIKVGNVWHICEDVDDTIVTDSVIITCPDPRRVCPTFFCPYDCLGTGGICDYQSGECMCEYEGIILGNETVVDVCGLARHMNATSSESSHRPFVQRQEQEAARPPPETSLSDYYFDGVEKLRDEPLIMKPWMIGLICAAVFVFLSGIATLWTLGSKSLSSDRARTFQFWNLAGNVNTEDFDLSDNVSPDKHKMVATVLVDMRINGGNNRRWRFPSRQQNTVDLNESLADTEDRCTDSEVASEAQNGSICDSDLSFRQSDCDTTSDCGGMSSSPNEEDLENVQRLSLSEPSISVVEEPQTYIRRRRGIADEYLAHSGP